ncbi:MAG: hypothetical protein SFU86_22530, partial [Pirellulaceae bacterium]|nr:hypothetical protein [Pirellulaceae bacterium]
PNLNGWTLEADDAECISTMEFVAAGELPEKSLAAWLRSHFDRQRYHIDDIFALRQGICHPDNLVVFYANRYL